MCDARTADVLMITYDKHWRMHQNDDFWGEVDMSYWKSNA
jgi:hypothetical protein